jgi:DNA-directed RNA polymerase subunit RPC12/RpoP
MWCSADCSIAAETTLKLPNGVLDEGMLVIEAKADAVRTIKRQINQITSRRRAAEHRHYLLQGDQDYTFRSVDCAHCGSVIDVSGLERTAYVYCSYCEHLLDQNGQPIALDAAYTTCPECSMFDRVKSYTEFYFYFLVFVYGFSYKQRDLCDRCAQSLFGKTFLLNLPFLLGLPWSIAIKLRSATGRDAGLQSLPKANNLARRGRYRDAVSLYAQMNARYPEHPGLLMNEGIGLLSSSDASGANEYFSRSLKACSNYAPVIRLLQQIAAAQEQQLAAQGQNSR